MNPKTKPDDPLVKRLEESRTVEGIMALFQQRIAMAHIQLKPETITFERAKEIADDLDKAKRFLYATIIDELCEPLEKKTS